MSHQAPGPNETPNNSYGQTHGQDPRGQAPQGYPQQGYAPADYPQGGYGQPPQRPGNGFGVAALVVGIIALLLAWIPVINIGAIVLGVIAVILGILGLRKKFAGRGMSIAGIVLGALAIIGSVIVLIATAAFVGLVEEEIQRTEGQEFSVEYIATVDQGEAQVSYGSAGGSSTESITGEWNEETTVTGFNLLSVTVTGDATAGEQQLGCEIRVNGETVAEESGTSLAACSAPTR